MSTPLRASVLVLIVSLAALATLLFAQKIEAPTKEPEAQVVAPVSDIPALRIEYATTEEQRSRGLSGRAEIPPHYGMLFLFPSPMRPGFWMKDMLVAIDIIWLSDSNEILGIEHSVSPDTYEKGIVFYPPEPVTRVLETRAGYANERGWEVGSIVPLPQPQ